MSPFETVYGRKPSAITGYIGGLHIPTSVETTLEKRDRILRTLHCNIQRAQ
ncbi:unnamed protein product [Rhodiola kirilowii]